MTKTWYSYCPENGIELWNTEEEARENSQADLDAYRDAAACDGWHEDMEALSWGRLVPVESAQISRREPAPEGSGFDELLEYHLLPVTSEKPDDN